MSDQFRRRSRARREAGQHPAPVFDPDLELITPEETPVFIPTA